MSGIYYYRQKCKAYYGRKIKLHSRKCEQSTYTTLMYLCQQFQMSTVDVMVCA